MKRMIRNNPNSKQDDEFDRQWEAKFGPDGSMKFDSLEEFGEWLEEVKRFEPVHNE